MGAVLATLSNHAFRIRPDTHSEFESVDTAGISDQCQGDGTASSSVCGAEEIPLRASNSSFPSHATGGARKLADHCFFG